MLQTNRLRDPYPLTWEIPVGVAATTLLLAVLGVQLGRSLAHWTAGGGWVWPRGRALFTSLAAILNGHATAGLDQVPVPSAGATAVIGWIVTIELILATAVVTTTLLLLRRWGPGRMRGMATPQQARSTLGPGRLRRARTIIRPDLYPPRQNRRTP